MSRSSDAPQGLHMACQGQGGPVQYTYRAHRAPKPTGPRGQAPTIGPKAASHTALPHTRPHPTTCTGRARTASPSAIQGQRCAVIPRIRRWQWRDARMESGSSLSMEWPLLGRQSIEMILAFSYISRVVFLLGNTKSFVRSESRTNL